MIKLLTNSSSYKEQLQCMRMKLTIKSDKMKYLMHIPGLILTILVLTVSCTEKESRENITSVYYSENEDLPMDDFIDRIEVVPLETDSMNLIDQYHKIEFYDDFGGYLIVDKKQTVYLFSKDGSFISSSRKCRGNGPDQYNILVDAVYNPYTKSVEILNPFGSIYSYDLSFNFLGKRDLQEKSIHTFSRFYPLGDDSYILLPTLLGEKDAVMYFCDYSRQSIISVEDYTADFISTLTMNHNPFVRLNGELYFLPVCLDYNIYRIDEDSCKLSKYMIYSLGENEVHKEDLEKRFGYQSNRKSDEESLKKSFAVMEKVNDYLLQSDVPIPVIKQMNDSYLYFYVIRNGARETVIYDRKSEKSILHSNKHPVCLNFCLHLDGNHLYSIIHPYEVEKHIEKSLLDEDELEKLDHMKEDDNPIIVKYVLK